MKLSTSLACIGNYPANDTMFLHFGCETRLLVIDWKPADKFVYTMHLNESRLTKRQLTAWTTCHSTCCSGNYFWCQLSKCPYMNKVHAGKNWMQYSTGHVAIYYLSFSPTMVLEPTSEHLSFDFLGKCLHTPIILYPYTHVLIPVHQKPM